MSLLGTYEQILTDNVGKEFLHTSFMTTHVFMVILAKQSYICTINIYSTCCPLPCKDSIVSTLL